MTSLTSLRLRTGKLVTVILPRSGPGTQRVRGYIRVGHRGLTSPWSANRESWLRSILPRTSGPAPENRVAKSPSAGPNHPSRYRQESRMANTKTILRLNCSSQTAARQLPG